MKSNEDMLQVSRLIASLMNRPEKNSYVTSSLISAFAPIRIKLCKEVYKINDV
jgi:hypothetical protein